jgi:hypothetical protein
MKYKTGKINWASVSHAYNPSYTVGRDQKDGDSKLETLSQKYPSHTHTHTHTHKRGGGRVAQMVEDLSSKCEAKQAKLPYARRT